MRQARSFERIPLPDACRRDGFRTFAPEVLPGETGKEDFPAVWREKKYVKEALKKMTQGHCAYCQSSEEANGHGRVEHYCPKSLFPTLAYEWDNYFYSCELCNWTKSDKWPDDGGYVRPDKGDPYRTFVFDEQGRISVAGKGEGARRTIEDFGLDREGLNRARRLHIEGALGPVRLLRDSALKNRQRLKEYREMVRDMIRRVRWHSPYSAAVRQNLRRVWNDAFPKWLV